MLVFVVLCATALLFGTAAIASAEGEAEAEAWQVRTIPTPVSGTVPSFVSAANGYLAWTGAKAGGYSSMYMFTLVSGVNTAFPTALAGNYYNPSADGPWVAYQGARAGAYTDIYLYDTGNGLVQQITRNSDAGDSWDWNPRVDNGRIVWEKDMTGAAAKPGIYLYDVQAGTTTLIIAGDGYRDPDISGDYVVCTKPADAGGGSEIILYNLTTDETKTIADGTKSNEDPRIDSGQVVWSSHDIWEASAPVLWFTYQIQLYDIATGTTTALTNDVAGNTKPSVKDGLVVWKTKEQTAIMLYDSATGFRTQLSAQGDTVEAAPEVADGGIAWCGTKGLYYAVPASEATRFPDVLADHPYATAIQSMADQGIIEGYKSGYFGLPDLVTRQQFAKMIVLTMAVNNPAQFTPTLSDIYDFTDSAAIEHVDGELYAYHYVAKAALTGLTVGYPNGSFRPLNNISRQQVITMIVRAGSQVLQPPPSSWQGDLAYTNAEHGQRIRLAEYNGLLSGIVGPQGTLSGWNTTANATRGEVAQMLYNLLGKFSTAE